MSKLPTFRLSTLALLLGAALPAGAVELYADADTRLQANLEAAFGIFHSRENYALSGRLQEGSSSWREGYLKYGLSFDQGLGAAGSSYGAFSLLSSATWGDGDAAGLTDGSERTTKIEDAYLGWRSGELFEALLQSLQPLATGYFIAAATRLKSTMAVVGSGMRSPAGLLALLTWLSVALSSFMDNVPYTILMIPVCQSLAASMGIAAWPLLYGMLIGTGIGGNITPVGATANVFACGVLERQGVKVSLREYLRISIPASVGAVLTAHLLLQAIWL